MNNERMTYLLTYLDGLAKLTANNYKCNTEIGECIGMIREEFMITNTSGLVIEGRELTGYIDKWR